MNRSLRVLLFAHHQVGLAVLHGLRESGHQIDYCYSHPDGDDWIPSVPEACAELGLPYSTITPHADAAENFRADRPDLIVTAGFRRRVGLPFLALAAHGAINAHLAPLPRYRGPSPIRWGILDREPTWGVTIHAMTHNYNEGGVLLRQPVPLRESENCYDLFSRSSDAAAAAMIQTVNEIAAGRATSMPQELRGVQFFDQSIPYGGHIDWSQPAIDLAAFVRAMDFGRPEVNGYRHLSPPAHAILIGQDLSIWRARAGGTASPYPPGTITRCDGEVWVQTGRGHLVVEKVCDASGQDQSAAEYLAARGVAAGQMFDTRHSWRPSRAALHAA